MIDMLNKVKSIITTGSTEHKLNAQVFIGEQPASTDSCISLILMGGGDSDAFFGQSEVIKYPVVKIMVRNVTYVKANSDVESLVAILDKYMDEDFIGMTQIGQSNYIGTDDKNRSTFTLDFKIIIEE